MARDARGEEPFKAAEHATGLLTFLGLDAPLVAMTSEDARHEQ